MPVATVPQLFIAGLGNLPYPMTRHSVGQLVIDALATRLGIQMKSDRGGYSGHGNVFIGSTSVNLTLFKSKSLMNISGPSIVKAYRQTVNSPASMIILTDSLDHRVTALSVKLGGSANGHNGVKSIISALGGESGFYRFRLGIGRDETDAAAYVLQRLSSHERQYWNNEGLDAILREIEKVALKAG
ncbi:peptidyl-tRNA hydrolase [Gymnopilus junonius]|uniref:peptidyl-tRNA hydrolase n=1 Tax=Gymnopilus junonius TaxID=109634 RepID=A0A9P5NRK8_GYMJU|nr:peptidyl-tRNA hydrolase [Gymnopilus junonius]